MLPHDIVIETLMGFSFKGSEENQVHVCEQIAATTYEDLDDLVRVIEENAPKAKFQKELKELKSNKSFDPYWREQPK